MLILNLTKGRADGELFREMFPKESKISGLLDLCRHNLPVPEAIAFDSRHARAAEQAIGEFVSEVIAAGHLPLFAIRFETKGDDRHRRPPQTLLNAGYRAIDRETWKRVGPRLRGVIHDAYMERTGPYHDGKEPEFYDPAEEVGYWLLRMCARLNPDSGPCAVLIQRMVFGCADEKSGNGICCNSPGPPSAPRRFHGVFLPGQIGIPTVSGCWGPGQVPLAALRELNLPAFTMLEQYFDYLESIFGPNRYLEFTIEKEQLFFLQHLTRQREILVH